MGQKSLNHFSSWAGGGHKRTNGRRSLRKKIRASCKTESYIQFEARKKGPSTHLVKSKLETAAIESLDTEEWGNEVRKKDSVSVKRQKIPPLVNEGWRTFFEQRWGTNGTRLKPAKPQEESLRFTLN